MCGERHVWEKCLRSPSSPSIRTKPDRLVPSRLLISFHSSSFSCLDREIVWREETWGWGQVCVGMIIIIFMSDFYDGVEIFIMI